MAERVGALSTVHRMLYSAGDAERDAGRRVAGDVQRDVDGDLLAAADEHQVDVLQVTLRGGHSGADRPVRWVHISELEDPTPWLKGGELLPEAVQSAFEELATTSAACWPASSIQPAGNGPDAAAICGGQQLMRRAGERQGIVVGDAVANRAAVGRV